MPEFGIHLIYIFDHPNKINCMLRPLMKPEANFLSYWSRILFLLFAVIWLAIRFKIMTSCTWAFLPRIIVYNRYVWAFIPYTTIYIAYIRVFNTRICAKSNARLYALLKTRIYAYLSRPTYTRAKMCIYAGFRNQPWYKMARKVPLTE